MTTEARGLGAEALARRLCDAGATAAEVAAAIKERDEVHAAAHAEAIRVARAEGWDAGRRAEAIRARSAATAKAGEAAALYTQVCERDCDEDCAAPNGELMRCPDAPCTLIRCGPAPAEKPTEGDAPAAAPTPTGALGREAAERLRAKLHECPPDHFASAAATPAAPQDGQAEVAKAEEPAALEWAEPDGGTREAWIAFPDYTLSAHHYLDRPEARIEHALPLGAGIGDAREWAERALVALVAAGLLKEPTEGVAAPLLEGAAPEGGKP